MTQFAPVVAQIDVDADGCLRWHSDGKVIHSCTGCGSALYEKWRAPDVVWQRHRGTAERLCWACFQLSMDGWDFGLFHDDDT